jgi:Holliday junction resolvasome RuvABC endonuclease subunit
VLSVDDNLRRVREIAALLEAKSEGVDVICAESMSYPRNASSAAKVAMCWGVIATVSNRLDVPIIQVCPQDVKKRLCDSKKASKEDIQKAVGVMYPVAAEIMSTYSKARREHMADALAVIVASLDSDIFRMVRRNSGGNAGY